MQRIPLIKPYITQEIKDMVCEVLDSGYLTEGPVTKELDDKFKNYIGCNDTIELAGRYKELLTGMGDIELLQTYYASTHFCQSFCISAENRDSKMISSINPSPVMVKLCAA